MYDAYVLNKLGYDMQGSYGNVALVRDCCGNYYEVTKEGKFTSVPAPKEN